MSVAMTTETARKIKNSDIFKQEFKRNSAASIGVMCVRTRDHIRCLKTIKDMAIENELIFRLWACNKGWQDFTQNRLGDDLVIETDKASSEDAATIDIGKALDSLIKETRPGIYIMLYPHFHFEKPLIQQYLRDLANETRCKELRLIMIVPETVKIPVEIEDDIHIMDFSPPSHAELLDCYNEIQSVVPDEAKPEFSDEQVDIVVQNGLGMTYIEFETALALAAASFDTKKEEKQTVEDYVSVILKHKTEVIKKTDLLELMPSESMDNIGGFDLLKKWLRLRSMAYSDEARNYGIKVPKGILLCGPPGSGKSSYAKAVSDVFKVPLIKFDIGKVFGRFVGESEGRMRSALKTIDAMAPIILLVDEIDKGFGGIQGGGGDSGVGMRVLGSFLNWMQDRDNEKSPVFLCLTANNVIGLPPELMRRGRIDEIFACSFPSHAERIEILKIHLSKRGHTLSNAELEKVAVATDKYVGSELEGAVENALLEAFDKKLKAPTAELIIEQAQSFVPLYKAFADKINVMNEWCVNNAKPASSGTVAEKVIRKMPIRNIKTMGPIRGSKNLDS